MTISPNTRQFFSAPHKASCAWENLEALHTRCSLTPDSPALSLPGSSFLQDTGRLRPTSRPIFQLGSLSSQPGEMLPWSAPPQAISLLWSREAGERLLQGPWPAGLWAWRLALPSDRCPQGVLLCHLPGAASKRSALGHFRIPAGQQEHHQILLPVSH